MKEKGNVDVTCECKTKFCFGCLKEPHQPFTCASKWEFDAIKSIEIDLSKVQTVGGCLMILCQNCKEEFPSFQKGKRPKLCNVCLKL